MADVAATADRPTTVGQRPDGPRTWATNPEVCELVRQAHELERPGVRFYPQVANHCADLYDVLRKRDAIDQIRRAAVDRWHRITYTQAARDLYDDVESLAVGGKTKTASLRRWLNRLASAGLIEWRGHRGHWIEFRLLPVPALGSAHPAGVAQSVRAAES